MSNDNNLRKKTKSIFVVILLGAIGSGLWDVFLKDLLFYLGELFVRSATYLYSGYIDFLYKGVGASVDTLLYLPSILIVAFIMSLPVLYYVLLIKSDKENNKAEDEEKDNNEALILKKKKRVALLVILSLMSLQYLSILIKATSEMKAARAIERRLEIIRPYTTESGYYVLRSEFRLIDSKVKVENILKETHVLATKNNIELPEVKLLGIENPNKTVK